MSAPMEIDAVAAMVIKSVMTTMAIVVVNGVQQLNAHSVRFASKATVYNVT